MSPHAQRVAGGLVLLVAGILSLPVAASFLDEPGAENWIIPAQLLVMLAVGAGVTVAAPALARDRASTGRRAFTGMWWGLAATFVGVLVFWLLLNGFGGA